MLFDGLTGRGLPVVLLSVAAGRTTLVALLTVLSAGTLVLLPALVYLYVLFQRPADQPDT